jgi:hypothetical protein
LLEELTAPQPWEDPMSDAIAEARRAWVARVLNVAIVPLVHPDPAALLARMRALAKMVAAPGAPAHLATDLRDAGAALKSQDLDTAAHLLDAIEAGLATPPQEQEAPGDQTGKLSIGTLRLRWSSVQNARETALNNLHAACAAALADPGVQEHPQFDEIEQAAEAADDLMPSLDSAIGGALEQMKTDDSGKRETARKQALASIKSFRGRLDAEPALRGLEDPEFGGFAIHSEMTAALAAFETALQEVGPTP